MVSAADWPISGGPRFDGSAPGPRALVENPELGLEWQHPIGPGYSGVTVANGRAVTAFSDGTHDIVIAWSSDDGRELWRTSIGPTYRGHDGSTDGPVGTATLAGSRVYIVGPFGDLLALDADGGEVLWRRNLETDWGAPVPTYGFGSRPVEVDGVLVVPVGAPDHSVVGLDPDDGRVLWSLGSDGIDYATPVVVESGPRRYVIVAGSRDLVGLDPERGRRLWRHRHSEERGFDPTYPQLQRVGERLLLTFQDSAVLLDVEEGPESTRITEVWRSPVFKSSAAIPVAVGGHLYGYNGRFLTCADLETGALVWKSRELPGRGLIRVGDHLVVFGSGGRLTLVAATPAGYRESASLVVSDHGGYTAPSFGDGRIFVRNLTDVASVVIRAASAPAHEARESRPWPATGPFADWMRRVERASEPVGVVHEFLAAHPEFPVVEAEWVHFVYAGEADAVSIVGQMTDADRGEPLVRVGRSDLFARSYPAVPGGRWQYRLQVDLADPGVDPRNPNRGSGGFDETSEVLLQGFDEPEFVTATATEKGTLETIDVTSAAYGEDVPVEIYLPFGFDRGDRHPLIVMPNGPQWIEHGNIVGILDRVFEERSFAAIVALVPMQAWVAGSWGGNAVKFLGDELPAALDGAYPIRRAPRSRSLWTVEDKAAVGLTLALEYPRAYGRFAFQSPKLYFGQLPDVTSLARRATPFRIGWSRYEMRAAESGTDERAAARELFDRLRTAGVPVEGGEVVAGPGYRTWRAEADAILSFLLSELPEAPEPRPLDRVRDGVGP